MSYKDKNKGREYQREWKNKNKEKIREYIKKYLQKPGVKEKRKKYKEEYVKNNKERLKEYAKKYRLKNQKPKIHKRKFYKSKKKTRKCIYCGKKVEYYNSTSPNRKFCSLSCSTSYFNKLRTKKIKVLCKKCGKIFECCPCQKRIYCSRKCYIKLGSENGMWLNGKSFEPYGIEFNKCLKNQIRKRDNFTCQECKITESYLAYKNKKYNISLRIHHIDYNKNNNNPSNLISLCLKCHAKTNVNRKHWSNYFKMKIFIKELFNPENIVAFENNKLVAMERV